MLHLPPFVCSTKIAQPKIGKKRSKTGCRSRCEDTRWFQSVSDKPTAEERTSGGFRCRSLREQSAVQQEQPMWQKTQKQQGKTLKTQKILLSSDIVPVYNTGIKPTPFYLNTRTSHKKKNVWPPFSNAKFPPFHPKLARRETEWHTSKHHAWIVYSCVFGM